jgi:hypothetical protein
MPTGESTGVAALLRCDDGSRIFVKGLPVGHERAPELEREASVNPHLPTYAPRLLWQVEAGGWQLLAFQGLDATPWADFTVDSAHLDAVTGVLGDLSSRPAPEGLPSVWERWGHYCDPGDEGLLTGDRLVHGDPAATNFLVDGHRVAHLVDWAWAARGPAWVDAALWGYRLILDGGHTPEQARTRALGVPALARALPRAVQVLTEAEARSWEHWQDYGTEGLDKTVHAARQWAALWA